METILTCSEIHKKKAQNYALRTERKVEFLNVKYGGRQTNH